MRSTCSTIIKKRSTQSFTTCAKQFVASSSRNRHPAPVADEQPDIIYELRGRHRHVNLEREVQIEFVPNGINQQFENALVGVG